MKNVPTGTLLFSAAALLLGGCASLEQTAPAVSPQILKASRSADAGVLEHGRRILTTRCIKCHSLEPIGKYTPEEWVESLADMSKRSKLTPAEHQALERYVLAARAALPAM